MCELDLVFNFHKVSTVAREACNDAWHGFPYLCRTLPSPHPSPPVSRQVYAILDEYIISGELQETSQVRAQVKRMLNGISPSGSLLNRTVQLRYLPLRTGRHARPPA